MSALEFIFMGDIAWQTHRIAGQLSALRADDAQRHRDSQATLGRLEALEAQSVQIAAQRLKLLEISQSEDAKRRHVTAALVLHENELDRLLAARDDVQQPDGRTIRDNAVVAIRETLATAIAFKARTITLGVGLSGVSIGDLPTIDDQRHFLAIVQKAESHWQAFCSTHARGAVDELELAVVSKLCEDTMRQMVFDTIAYIEIVNDADLRRHFDGTSSDAIRDAQSTRPPENPLAPPICGLLASCAGIAVGVYIGYDIIQQGGFWNAITGLFWMAALAFGGGYLGYYLGNGLGHVISTERLGASRQEVINSRAAAVARAADLASDRLLTLNDNRLDYDPTSAWFKDYVKGLPDDATQRIWPRISHFWSSLAAVSPAIATFNAYDFSTTSINNARALDAYVAVVLAREAHLAKASLLAPAS